MKELFVSSDNKFLYYPRFYHLAQEKLSKEQRKLLKDFLHKTSRKIANFYDLVCIEDQALKLGKSVADNG